MRDELRYVIPLNFSKGETGGRAAGFITEIEILGMPNTKNYDRTDCFAYFGEIVDIFCGNSKSAPATNIFTQ